MLVVHQMVDKAVISLDGCMAVIFLCVKQLLTMTPISRLWSDQWSNRHYDPSDIRERAREGEQERCGPARLSVITVCVFHRLPGETTRREEDFTFLLPDPPTAPHPTPSFLALPLLSSPPLPPPRPKHF